ncbi:MAG TPA: leucyl aminopeptidase family protein [Streptosporangiaceae bacterium]|nr:leucyl aminopeptidase family protein [Streptosporangiaceae bacterium]
MAIVTGVSLLPQAGPQPVGGYLAAAAEGASEPADLIAVAVQEDGSGPADFGLDERLPASAAEIIACLGLTGMAGEAADTIARIGQRAVRVVFLGVGDQSPAALRRAGASLGRQVADGKSAVADAVVGGSDEALQAFAEGILLGSYQFRLKSGADGERARPGEVRLLTAGPRDRGAVLEKAVVIAEAVGLARDLTNVPSARKSPQWLAAQAAAVASERGLGSRVWTEDELAAGGFGGILAVGAGSVAPPRLIELSYAPDGAAGHVVLVGKGITFDSGGLSLKPNDNMQLMKTDMAGGAVVIAVASALARLGVARRVTGLVAAAENMPSGSAYRPGDVITQYGGRSVEVLNTDAEGRLVLADALAYADAVLEPDQLVDVATLTGAARVALGASRAALYSTSEALAGELLAAGRASGDRLWRMPLEDSYAAALESPVADLAHVARDGAAAGSILAALFLRGFTGQRAWAHLDIAGSGRAGADDGELTKGGTGFGTRLLLRWLSEGQPRS